MSYYGTDKKGYLIPAIIDPQEFGCFAFYYPKSDEYLAIVSGHIHELTKWLTWEKDGTDRASQVAGVWRQAIDMSVNELWDNGVYMSCADFTALIEAITNQVINVTCGGGCGGGSGNTLKDWRVPDGWQTTVPSQPIPESSTPTTEPVGIICDAAYQAHAEIRFRLENYWTLVFEESPYADLYNDLTTWALGNPYATALWDIMNTVGGLFYNSFEADMLAYWDTLQQPFVCAMVQETNGEDFKAWLLSYLRANEPNWSVGYWIETVLTGTIFTPIYDGSYTVDAQYIGSDCSACSEVEEIETGFYMMPVNTLFSFQDVNSPVSLTNQGGNLWELILNPNTGFEMWPELIEHGFDWDIAAGASRMGYRVEVVSITGGSLITQGAAQACNGTSTSLVVEDDVRGRDANASPALDTWLASGTKQTGFTGLNRQYIRMIQNGGAGQQTYTVRLWVVMDAGGQV